MIKPYNKYLDTKVKGIGLIPESWRCSAIKHVLSVPITDGPHTTPELLEDGIPFISAEAIKDGKIDFTKKRGYISESDYVLFSKKYIPKKDDIFMVKSGATTGNVAMLDQDIKFSIWSPLAVFRANQQKILPKYLHFYLQSNNLRYNVEVSWSYGTQQNIGMGILSNLRIPYPSIPEQVQIVRYLEYQTKIIDRLIIQKEKILELLKEKRQSIINETVTKGLMPKVKMKDTGIDWLGQIPEGWDFKNLETVASKERYSITGGPFGSDLKNEEYTEQGVRIIQLQNIGVGEFRDDYKIYTSQEKANQLSSCNIFPGEIIIAKMADPVARACIIPKVDKRYLMASDGIRLKVNTQKFNVKFIEYAINSKYFNFQAEIKSSGTTRLRIGLTTLKKLKLILPDLFEQNKIVDFLEAYDSSFYEISDKILSQIRMLRELRHSMISEAITGKLDLREWKLNKANLEIA